MGGPGRGGFSREIPMVGMDSVSEAANGGLGD